MAEANNTEVEHCTNISRDSRSGMSMDEERATRFEAAIDDVEIAMNSLRVCTQHFPLMAMDSGCIDPAMAVDAFTAKMNSGLQLIRAMLYCEEVPEKAT